MADLNIHAVVFRRLMLVTRAVSLIHAAPLVAFIMFTKAVSIIHAMALAV